MKMHALVCVWVLRFKIGWRLLAVFRSNRGSLGLVHDVAKLKLYASVLSVLFISFGD